MVPGERDHQRRRPEFLELGGSDLPVIQVAPTSITAREPDQAQGRRHRTADGPETRSPFPDVVEQERPHQIRPAGSLVDEEPGAAQGVVEVGNRLIPEDGALGGIEMICHQCLCLRSGMARPERPEEAGDEVTEMAHTNTLISAPIQSPMNEN